MKAHNIHILGTCLEVLALFGLRRGWGLPAAPWLLAWVLHAVIGLVSARSWRHGHSSATAIRAVHPSSILMRAAVAPAAILAAAGRLGGTPLRNWLPCPAVLYTLARLWPAGKVKI